MLNKMHFLSISKKTRTKRVENTLYLSECDKDCVFRHSQKNNNKFIKIVISQEAPPNLYLMYSSLSSVVISRNAQAFVGSEEKKSYATIKVPLLTPGMALRAANALDISCLTSLLLMPRSIFWIVSHMISKEEAMLGFFLFDFLADGGDGFCLTDVVELFE